MKRLFIKGLNAVTLVTAIALTSHAQAAADTLKAVNDVRVLLDKVNMDYQMFKGENANPKYGDALKTNIDALKQARDKLQDKAEAAGKGEDAKPIISDTDRYLKLLNGSYKSLARGGYETPAIAEEMVDKKKSAQDADTALYTSLTTDAKVDKRIIEYQNLSYLMQQMAALYLEYAASVYGVGMRSHEGEKTIDQLAQDFSQRLKKLDVDAKDLPVDVKSQLNDVKRKWGFIEQSMLNYMQNQVSFLVYRYSNTIVDDLLGASRALGGDDDAPIDEMSSGGNGGSGIPMPPGLSAAKDGK